MKWSVNYLTDNMGKQPVKEWIDTLEIKLQVKIFRAFELLEDFNINLKAPYVKPLEDKLYELKTKKEFIELSILLTRVKSLLCLMVLLKKLKRPQKKR